MSLVYDSYHFISKVIRRVDWEWTIVDCISAFDLMSSSGPSICSVSGPRPSCGGVRSGSIIVDGHQLSHTITLFISDSETFTYFIIFSDLLHCVVALLSLTFFAIEWSTALAESISERHTFSHPRNDFALYSSIFVSILDKSNTHTSDPEMLAYSLVDNTMIIAGAIIITWKKFKNTQLFSCHKIIFMKHQL